MVDNIIVPFRATHPGEVLKDELKARNIQQTKFAVKIGISKTMLNEIIHGKRPITTEFAVLLEKTLDINASYWLTFQTNYELDLIKINTKKK
ncbi:MAG: HigA family addiction module antitoxin [bacterium]